MKKFYLKHTSVAGWLMAVALALPLTALAQQNVRRPHDASRSAMPKAKLQLKETDGAVKTAYGILSYDETDSKYINGLVSFPLDDGGQFTHIRLFGDATHDVTAAAYAEGYYYIERTVLDGETMVPESLLRYDIDNDKVDTVGALNGFVRHINDMTYDYSTKKMYAINCPYQSNSVLYTIDLNTAESTTVASLDSAFFTLACTYDGRLYGITFQGYLCSIDKTTGALTTIGHTGYHPTYFQSMEFDHDTETLYWAADLREYDTPDFIAEVDTATALAYPIGQVGNGPEIAGLYIPFSASAIGTPAAASDFTAKADAEGANQAVITWTNPTKTYDGKPLTALTKVTLYRNKEVVKEFTDVAPGAAMSYTDVTESGMGQFYNYSLIATNATGDGAEAKSKVFVGHDIPAAVSALQLTQPAYDEADLSWNAVTAGVNGGYVDKSSLVYSVVRMPGNKVLTSGLTDTQYADKNITPAQQYYYIVKASNADGESESVQTTPQVMGPTYGMPVDFDFTSSATDDSWTVVDGNGDGYAWMWTTTSSGKVMGHQASNTAVADDWLISYYMPFEQGVRYRLDFDVHAYSADHVDFYLLDKMDYAAPLQTISSYDFQGNKDIKHHIVSFTANQSGMYNLALHATSPMRADWLEMYNLNVRKAETYNLSAISLSGESQPMVGKESTYTLTVENQGVNKIYAFRAILKDHDGNELVHKDVAKTLNAGDKADVELAWTPADKTVSSIVGEVMLMGATDEYAADNQTDSLVLNIREAFDGDVVAIGTTSTTSSSYAPFDFSNQHAAALSIYSADEVGLTEDAYVTKAAWLYDALSLTYKDVVDAPVKVYMANTDKIAPTEWIPEDELTLVYDGTVNITRATSGELTLPLTTPFAYKSGKNLAILTTIDCSEYYPYISFTQYTSPVSGNCAFEWGAYYSSTGFDFTQTGHKDWYTRMPAVMLYMSKTVPAGIRPDANLGDADYELYDLAGHKLAAGQLSNGAVPSASLASGIYVVSVKKADGQRETMKICVRK